MKKRTHIDFSKHEVLVTENEGLVIHYLKKPGTITDSIKFINTNGILAVTGDYGNWIFCRPFVPSAKSDLVSDGYWIEKLQISSCQNPYKHCPEETTRRIKEIIAELEYGYSEQSAAEMREYYEDCLTDVDDEYDYIITARNYPPCADYECMIFGKVLNPWLNAVFDGYDEICTRLKNADKTN